MVVVTSVMSFFASGIFFRGFGVLVLPIREQLGITQAQTNLVFSIARAEGGLEGAAGRMADRQVRQPQGVGAVADHHRRRLCHHGLLAAGVLGDSPSSIWAWVSLGNSMGFQHACFAGLNQWFHRRRALAISILAAVASLGGLALIPTMNLLIDKAGLRWGLIASRRVLRRDPAAPVFLVPQPSRGYGTVA